VARSKAPKTTDWLRDKGPGYPLVLSSRARVARNLEGLPFPIAAGEEELERARGMVLESVSKRVAEDRDWDIRFAEELSRNRLEMMAEGHMTSPSFADRVQGRAIATGPSDGRSVMVNQEDHVRIQAVLPGAQFMKAWKAADEVDSLIESEVQYSFDQKYGYLTSCPSNVGTGLRVSAMLHLPALVITGEVGKTTSALAQAGIYVRGLYGEGSGIAGNIFQISNRQTLGRTEEFIISNMDTIVRQVVDNERTARKMLLREDPLDLADRSYRALGVVERCRRAGYYEALELISLIKLGVDTEVLPVGDFNILEVGVAAGPYHIREALGGEAVEEEIDRERAVQLRRMLGL
jgi:protein arginine kinase